MRSGRRWRSFASPTSLPSLPTMLFGSAGNFDYSRPMSDLLLMLQYAVQAAFVLLAVATLADWFRHRDGRRSYLALAFGSLATLIVLSPAFGTPGALGQVLTDAGVVVFLISGYALLMFRDSFIPLGQVTRRTITI